VDKTSIPSIESIAQMDEEQLPVAKHKLHNWLHFFGLYGAEHVAATEFVFGATFVALGAGLWDVLIGLIIGNTLATLSFTLLTARIAVDTRLSLYTYLDRIAGGLTSRFYGWWCWRRRARRWPRSSMPSVSDHYRSALRFHAKRYARSCSTCRRRP
jgi:hypothetical protein